MNWGQSDGDDSYLTLLICVRGMQHSFFGNRFWFLVLEVVSAPSPVRHSRHLQGEHQAFRTSLQGSHHMQQPDSFSGESSSSRSGVDCLSLQVHTTSGHTCHKVTALLAFRGGREEMSLVTTFHRGWGQESVMESAGKLGLQLSIQSWSSAHPTTGVPRTTGENAHSVCRQRRLQPEALLAEGKVMRWVGQSA